jgi:hypothetical protein
VIVVVPHETAVARPVLLPTVATPELLDAHVAMFVRMLLFPAGEYTPSAMNWEICPSWMVGLVGKRLIACNTGVCTTVHETVSGVWLRTPRY